jgi:hypothetical protein
MMPNTVLTMRLKAKYINIDRVFCEVMVAERIGRFEEGQPSSFLSQVFKGR